LAVARKKVMKKIILTTAALLVIAALALVLSLTAAASDAYTEIRTASDLENITSDGNYKLVSDITLTKAVTIEKFSGHFDGNGKTVSGISAPLFRELSGTVSDLTLKGSIDVSGKTLIAPLANTLTATGKVDTVICEVTMSGSRPAAAMEIGGIVGRAKSNSVIKNSTNRGNITVTGAYNAENENAMGGIVGRIETGASLIRCENYGTLYANGGTNTADFKGAVGGIVGISNGTTYITDCLNAGNIKASASKLCIAGILGRTETDNTACPVITGCVNKGTVEKTSDLGERPAGIASYVRGGKITWCVNLGKITSSSQEASGIVGYYNGSGAILNLEYNLNAGDVKSYAILRVNGTANLKPVSNFYIAGKTACNSSISGTLSCTNAADMTAKVMALDEARYLQDFGGEDAVNGGYPILKWQCTHVGDLILDADLGKICTKCSEVIGTIDCEHTFGAWTTVTPATETENGLKKRECTKCHAIDSEVILSETSVIPVNGVYTVTTAGQLAWVFSSIETGTIPADATLKLGKDIDLGGSLATLQTAFTGTFDGNGKTLSGVSHTLFLQFNGTATDLTLRGDIDYSAASHSKDVARKAASFAHNVKNATLDGVVSYVNLTTARNDLNAGGLIGYANGSNLFVSCAYFGRYSVDWKGDGAGIGGIVGWSNASGGTTTFNSCVFGGTLKVTGGVSGNDAVIGGILGNCTNPTVIFTNCLSNGTVTSEITAGTDYIGGIVGSNKSDATVIEFVANKSVLTAKNYAGGIVGGMTAKTSVSYAVNYAKINGATVGAIGGTTGGKNFEIAYSADCLAGSEMKLANGSSVQTACYTADKVKDLNKDLTFDGISYKRYNFGLVDKASGIPVPVMTSKETFTPYVSMLDQGDTHALRFVVLTKYSAVHSSSVTLTVTFYDGDEKVIKTKTARLATQNSDLEMYAAVKAAGEPYFAAEGFALFGFVITDIPTGAWDSLTLSITDTASGKDEITPVAFRLDSMQLSFENLPDFSTLGTVSPTYNAGPGLVSDRFATTTEDSFVKVITNTDAKKLEGYTAVLRENGFKEISKNVLDGDTYYSYEKYGKLIYLYHNHRISETRIVIDNASDRLSKLEIDYTPKAGDTTEFYQYSINYDLANKVGYDPVVYTESGTINCGMCYIIKLADNSVIVIDGGHEKQSTQRSRQGLLDFLRKITDTKAGEKVRIATWFFSHAHGDHVRLGSDFINDFHDEIDLMSVTYNFPSYQYMSSGYDSNTFNLKQSINTHFPRTRYHKLHTGEVMNMAGVMIEVVYSHEDAITSNGTTEIGDFNSTSTVLKITFDNKTLMLLGDTNTEAENAIVAMHSGAYLKSDMVQVSHHCFNFLNKLYPLINAKIALFPQSAFNVKDPANGQGNLYKYQSVMVYATEEYFAHKYTYKFTVVDGKVVSEALPRYDAK